jgi:hypothetical protein
MSSTDGWSVADILGQKANAYGRKFINGQWYYNASDTQTPGSVALKMGNDPYTGQPLAPLYYQPEPAAETARINAGNSGGGGIGGLVNNFMGAGGGVFGLAGALGGVGALAGQAGAGGFGLGAGLSSGLGIPAAAGNALAGAATSLISGGNPINSLINSGIGAGINGIGNSLSNVNFGGSPATGGNMSFLGLDTMGGNYGFDNFGGNYGGNFTGGNTNDFFNGFDYGGGGTPGFANGNYGGVPLSQNGNYGTNQMGTTAGGFGGLFGGLSKLLGGGSAGSKGGLAGLGGALGGLFGGSSGATGTGGSYGDLFGTLAGAAIPALATNYLKNLNEPDTSQLQGLMTQFSPQAQAAPYDLQTAAGRNSLTAGNDARGVTGSSFGNFDLAGYNTLRDIGRQNLINQGIAGQAGIANSILHAQQVAAQNKTNILTAGLGATGMALGGNKGGGLTGLAGLFGQQQPQGVAGFSNGNYGGVPVMGGQRLRNPFGY